MLAAATDPTNEVFATARLTSAAAGYRSGITDCSFPAGPVFGYAQDGSPLYTFNVYLQNEEDARLAQQLFESAGVPAAAGLVSTYCLD